MNEKDDVVPAEAPVPEETGDGPAETVEMPEEPARTCVPEKLIPFRIREEEALEKYRKYYRGRWLLPGAFLKPEHLQELQAGYVPYMLHSGTARCTILYNAQDTKPQNGPDKIDKKIDNYSVRREGMIRYERVPVIAPGQFPEASMRKLEPFRFKELIPIEKYPDADQLEGLSEARIPDDPELTKVRLGRAAAALFRDSVTHDFIQETERNVTVLEDSVECVLLPFHILVTRFRKKDYLFAVNGQTGAVAGDLPVDIVKVMGAFFGFFAAGGAVAAAVAALVLWLIRLFTGALMGQELRIILFAAVIVGMFAANHFIYNLHEKMRPPQRKTDNSKQSVQLECIDVQEDQLNSTQLVSKRNVVQKEEVFHAPPKKKPAFERRQRGPKE